jgi:NADPH-dependent 2,4-dienoyl-CoA reductase/sulfur reductase-like enzyme
MSGIGMSSTRRDLLKVSAVGLAGTLAGQNAGVRKKVIVIGAGIAGLSCGYELMRRGLV